MRTSSHALYAALTADLQRYLPNCPEVYHPASYCQVNIQPDYSSIKSVAAASLLKSILKKFQDETTASCDQRALDMFIRMNDKCRGFSLDLWSLPSEVIQVLTWAKTYIDNLLHLGPISKVDPLVWVYDGDFGPGASVGASGTSFYHKAASGSLTLTDPILYSFYMESIRFDKSWIKAEKLRRDLFGRPDIVSGSKFAFVPKTTEISRTICIEPSLNMFLQKGLASQLELLLRKSFGFDLSVQQFRNKRLARKGSRDGTLSTIDLSSASDTISLGLCEWLLPGDLFAQLLLLRSPCTTLPSGEVVDLHMVSSMGNAFTFPLQTIIFSALVLGSYAVCGIPFHRPTNECDGNAGVFGDDIVVDSRVFDVLCRSIDACGFVVNQNKSFNVGLFRESCGGDYFDGHNVRGVYCTSLKTAHVRYSLINRLNVWSANHGIGLPATISWLRSTVRDIFVPPWDSDIAGIKVPLAFLGRRRYDGNGCILYKRMVAETLSFDVSDIEHRSRPYPFRIVSNPDGIMIAAVKGTLRNGSISMRLFAVRPRYRFGIAPCWDYVDLDHSLLESGCWSRWKHLTSSNLVS